MEAIEPESSGLTNLVSGRLSFFSKGEQAPADAADVSALPTPNKEGPTSDFVVVQTDPEADAVVIDTEEPSEEDKAHAEFRASLEGMSRAEVRNKIGESLYAAISAHHPELAGKLTGMFLEATENFEDLSGLLFSPSSLQLHVKQAISVLESVNAAAAETAAAPGDEAAGPSPSRAKGADSGREEAGNKRVHPRETGARQYPYNGKKARTERAWFAEIVDDSGKRTKVPCKYDVEKKMYVPTGGRDVVPGGKVGTRDKTAEDLQALDIGEADPAKLRARQKQLDIGKKSQGYKKLMEQKLRGYQLQDLIKLPYITEEGVLELTLKCSKKRYDGYLRMWKRKLYEYAGLQRLDFTCFPPLSTEEAAAAVANGASKPLATTAAAPAPAAPAAAGVTSTRQNSRKQSNPSRLPAAAPAAPKGSWAKKLNA